MNWKRIAMWIVAIIVVIALFSFFYGKCNPSPMKEEQKQFEKKDEVNKKKEEAISVSIDSSKTISERKVSDITRSEDKVKDKKQQSNEDRTRIIALPPDEQFVLFTSWLPQVDTFR